MSATSAGHPSLILLRRSPVLIRLIPSSDGRAKGPPFHDPLKRLFSEEYEALVPGDTLVAYTDGVGEALAAGSQDEQEWAEKIINLASGHARSCEEIAQTIISAAEDAGPLHDDMTVWVVKMKPKS